MICRLPSHFRREKIKTNNTIFQTFIQRWIHWLLNGSCTLSWHSDVPWNPAGSQLWHVCTGSPYELKGFHWWTKAHSHWTWHSCVVCFVWHTHWVVKNDMPCCLTSSAPNIQFTSPTLLLPFMILYTLHAFLWLSIALMCGTIRKTPEEWRQAVTLRQVVQH